MAFPMLQQHDNVVQEAQILLLIMWWVDPIWVLGQSNSSLPFACGQGTGSNKRFMD